MSATVIAVAGIIGTLSSPMLAERMKRRSARGDRQHDRRLTLYADLMQATAKIADNARSWSAMPLAELDEPEDSFLDRMFAQVRVVASDQVRDQTLRFQGSAGAFNRRLLNVRALHRRVYEAGDGDSGEAIQSRFQLGGLADEVVDDFKRLESTVRREMAR